VIPILTTSKVLGFKEGLKSLYGVSMYRNAGYLMMNSGSTAVIGFIFWMVAARLYSIEAVGMSSAIISAVGLLTLLSNLGLGYGLIGFLPGSGAKTKVVINSCFTIVGLISMVLSFIYLAGLSIWSPALLPFRELPLFFIAFVAVTVASTLKGLIDQTFIAKRRAGFTLAQGLIFSLLRFIPLIALASFYHIFGIFSSWGIAILAAIIISLFLFLPRIQTDYRFSPAIMKKVPNEMIRFSSANYISTLLWSIPNYVLPLMVLNILGVEANAYFYIGWSVAAILASIPTATSFSLFAEGAWNMKNLREEVKRSLKLTLVLLIPAVIILVLLGDKILLFFGKAYSENAIKLVWILALSSLPMGINHIYFGIKRVEMKMKNLVVLSGLMTIIMLGLSWTLLPLMGILGVGVARLVSQAVIAMFTMGSLANRFRAKTNNI